MATSTTTLLEAINKVLKDVGERSASSSSSTPASEKAASYIKEAWQDFQQYHDWSWQKTTFSATSWDNEKATFTGLKNTIEVRWNNDTTIAPLDLVSFSQFYNYRELLSFEDKEKTPRYFAFVNNDTIAINPYPTDTTGRSRLTVYGYRFYDDPSSDTDTFDCPEAVVNTLLKKATATMLQRHLGEVGEARELLQDFEVKMRFLRSKEQTTKSSGFNMFRRFDTRDY